MKIVKPILFVGIILLFLYSVLACDITIDVEGGKKGRYNIGDTLIVKVTVMLSHRVCNVPIQETKFETQGLKVIGAKDWKEVGYLTYERELKLVVTGIKSVQPTITAIRTCDKEGGLGKLSLPCDGCTGCSSGTGCPIIKNFLLSI